MEWIKGIETTMATAERQFSDIPQWAKAEHMEASVPLCELWKLSDKVSDDGPVNGQNNFLKKFSTLSPFYSLHK